MDFELVFVGMAILFFMSFAGERLVELFKPLFAPLISWLQKITKLPDGWWMRIFSMVVVGALVAMTEINALENLIPSPMWGRIVTVILGSGGSNFLHNIWPQKPKPTVNYGPTIGE